MKNLPKPNGQLEEVLYELLTRKSISQRQMTFDTGIVCLTARISDLRDLGVDIPCDKVKFVNKWGRKSDFGEWSLSNKEHATDVYLELKKR